MPTSEAKSLPAGRLRKTSFRPRFEPNQSRFCSAPLKWTPAAKTLTFNLEKHRSWSYADGRVRLAHPVATNGQLCNLDSMNAFRIATELKTPKFSDHPGPPVNSTTRRHQKTRRPPGFSQTTPLVATNDGYLTAAATLANPYPQGIQQPTGSSLGLATFAGKNVTFYDPTPGYAYSTRWQMSVQRELFPGVLLEVGYMGNKAVKMPVDRSFHGTPLKYLSTSASRDQATIDWLSANVSNPFAGLLPGTNLNRGTVSRSQLLAPFPHFAGANGVAGQAFTDGSSSFHALEARIEKRSRLNDWEPLLEKRIAAEDRPYRVVWSGTYDLPFGTGKAFMKSANRLVNLAVGDWNVNVITTFTPGAPLNWGNVIYLGGPLNLTTHNVDGAFDTTQSNRIPAQQLASNRRTFPSRFANLCQDSVQQVDFSLIKGFRITETVKMTYRCEFFNSTNRAIFNAPDLGPTSSTFGRILGQANSPRRIQMALRLVF